MSDTKNWYNLVAMNFAVAGFASKAKNILSNRNYKILIIGLSILLIYFGVDFLIQI